MNTSTGFYLFLIVISLILLRKIQIRLRLSKAKHRSLTGHSKLSRRISKLIPRYDIGENRFFNSDGAPDKIAHQRRSGFESLSKYFKETMPKTIEMSEELETSISDVSFINTYRVPFQYANYVKSNLKLGTIAEASSGTKVKDLDGNWSYDLTGSYGVNVFGYDFYKECMDKGIQRVKELGPVLGVYHPLIADTVSRLKDISGLDEVSFHMSGTEAVMQAVRLARYHTGKSHLVRFCGAYHGWWDGVQPGIGNQRITNDVYTLKDMDANTMKVLQTRNDIACVLVNPLQAMHPNANPPSDAMLIASSRKTNYDRKAYSEWLQSLRQVCNEKGIVLIMDEIFVGFRLAYRGAQEYFNVQADMVTYGKTLGGGFPVGVVCGKHHLMKRYKASHPIHICFARGTFNSHPYVMATMNEFLRHIDTEEIRLRYEKNDELWDNRVSVLNNRLLEKNLPVKIVNIVSIWIILYTVPSRYNWMFQYYLRAQGLSISWIGSGRIIMSHDFTDNDYEEVMQRFVTAAQAMQKDGWWWSNAKLTNTSIKKQIFKEALVNLRN